MQNWLVEYSYKHNQRCGGVITIEADSAGSAESVARMNLKSRGLIIRVKADNREPAVKPIYRQVDHRIQPA